MKTWITWEREGEPPARITLTAEIAEAVEQYAAETSAAPVDVVAALVVGLAAELGEPVDGEARAAAVHALLARGPVLVTLRTQARGVDVPEALRDSPVVSLRIGHGLAPPIPDLVVDAAGIRGTLTFGGVPQHCVVPWRAVLAVQVEGASPTPPAAPAPARAARPKLRLV